MKALRVERKAVEMRDPVCGMTVGRGALKVDGHPELGFCSEHCRQGFLADPKKYSGNGPASDDSGNLGEAEPDDDPPIRAPGQTAQSVTTHLSVGGMTCASCVSTVESALRSVLGMVDARVNFAASTATVDTILDVPLSALAAAVAASGYRAVPIADESDTDTESADSARRYRLLIRKFWFAAAISVPVIYFSYPEIFPGVPDKGSTGLSWIWASMGVATVPVLAWSGSQFFTGAWQAIKHRSANMHTLIATGISAAWLYSTVAVVSPGFFPSEMLRDVFYDVTAVVTALVVLGMALEMRAPELRRSRRAAPGNVLAGRDHRRRRGVSSHRGAAERMM